MKMVYVFCLLAITLFLVPIEAQIVDRKQALKTMGGLGQSYMQRKQQEQNNVNKSKIEKAEVKHNILSSLNSDVDNEIPVVDTNNTNTFAVVIANENYQDVTKVEYAQRDGESFANYCKQALGLPESNVHLVKNATLNNIKREVNWLQQVCSAYGDEAKVLFYYAGHGIPDEASKTAFLLPIDGIGTDVTTGYSLKDLYHTLSILPTKGVIVLLDACFSGSQRGEGMLVSARGVVIKAKQETVKGNMVVISAAQGDETAYPYKEQGHGMFTYYLLKKLQETKGEATLGEISDYVTSEVRKRSIVINGKMQTPTLTSSSVIGDAWRNWKLK